MVVAPEFAFCVFDWPTNDLFSKFQLFNAYLDKLSHFFKKKFEFFRKQQFCGPSQDSHTYILKFHKFT
jgi:hypothetical protein